jgi:hypothetical protein
MMPTAEGPPVQAIVDLLSRVSPGVLGNLRARYPSYHGLLEPGKKLGPNTGPPEELLKELGQASIADAVGEGTALSQRLQKKIRLSARLRLAGSLVSSIASANLVVALVRDSPRLVEMSSAVIAFVSAGFTLMAQYVEDYAGGQKSLKDSRERAITLVTEARELESEFKLMVALNDFAALVPLVQKLNVAIAELRKIQLAMS